ncbi:alpha/beta hydrolase [Curtobacterium sp. MCBA15_012]|uniref:alpha/beta hydrolase n=1 Tax=Curtobacterium sp. MCBA15_012 TaxID=1898738 RepID=UPI0009226154|nr:alpha/beta hydrolase [Curtobacterium sp. MCBA15_012]WIB01048.1 alpha/beta hydrolase [Curtobacterium sp. MCBA15_012]
MLLIAAALLTASMHSPGVVEAPVVPAGTSSVVGAPTSGPAVEDHAALDHLVGSRGSAFLADLGTVDGADLARADRDARVLATAQDRPPTPAAVRTWWSGLDQAARSRLVDHAPAVVGNLDGVPYDVRDRANRSTLARGLAASGDGSALHGMLQQVEAALSPDPGSPDRVLVALDTRGSGRAAIAVGDLATAADVTVVVPGMFFTVSGQMHDFADTADGLYQEQTAVAGLAAPDPARGSGVAVVAWMGYRTPDMSNILSLGLADTGAERLERVVAGLDAVRGDVRPRLNVVAHSYGSTTAMTALSSGRMRADTLTVLGSPGSDVRSAAQLAVGRGEVFVGDAHDDPVAGTGYFGTDPGSPGFGSTLLDLSGGVPEGTAGLFRRPVGHNDYLKPGTSSLHEVALIAVGRGDLVRHQARRGSGGTGGPQPGPDMYLLRPQDLQPRD